MRAAAEGIAKSTQAALSDAREMLGGERRAVEASLEGMERALERFQHVVGEYDGLNENLGEAFAQFEQQVTRAISDVTQRANEIHENYTDALRTLENLVAQLHDFVPESAGR
jgi:predicted  nucleic acid-binding Zn-ribbon protein